MATFGTFVAGETLTAAELNAGLIYQNYTPSWSQSVTITKTVNWARYARFGSLVVASFKMTATSNGTSANAIKIGLPVEASADNFLMGVIHYIPNSGNPNTRISLFDTSTTVVGYYAYSTAPGATNARWGDSQVGSTIAINDIVFGTLTYEAA